MAENLTVQNDPSSSPVAVHRGHGSLYNHVKFCSFSQPQRKGSWLTTHSVSQHCHCTTLVLGLTSSNRIIVPHGGTATQRAQSPHSQPCNLYWLVNKNLRIVPKRIIKVSIIITWPRFILWQSSLSLVVQIALQVSEVIRVTRSLAQKCLRCEIRREENSSASTDPIRHLPARPLGRYELYYPLAWNMLPLPPPSSSLRAEILEPRMQHLKFFINALVAA